MRIIILNHSLRRYYDAYRPWLPVEVTLFFPKERRVKNLPCFKQMRSGALWMVIFFKCPAPMDPFICIPWTSFKQWWARPDGFFCLACFLSVSRRGQRKRPREKEGWAGLFVAWGAFLSFLRISFAEFLFLFSVLNSVCDKGKLSGRHMQQKLPSGSYK